MSILSPLVTRFAGAAVAVYLRVERRGRALPGGPVLLVVNHLNALVDPLVVFRTAGRLTRPLAKAPLFDHLLVGPILRSLGGLPIYRPPDDPDQVHRNQETFWLSSRRWPRWPQWPGGFRTGFHGRWCGPCGRRDAESTYKLGAALLAFPLMLIVCIVAGVEPEGPWP